jgi:putative CocE/NonD family hydrolase
MKSLLHFAVLFLFIGSSFAQHLSINDYKKTEHYIKTRDGTELYTVVYAPKSDAKKYPVLLTRTPYGCAPYGTAMPEQIMYNDLLVKEGYIFVCQDIRGRAMSDGEDMINMKPVYSQKDPKRTDEATDTYDTIDWLVKNIKNNNGKVGMYGHSYRGWTALMGAISRHKALKAVQAGASCIDIYFEDFSRYGLFALAYAPIMDWFGTPKTKREEGPWWERQTGYFSFYKSPVDKLDYDSYDFFLKKGALKNYGHLLSGQNYFYKYLRDHPDYDGARKERNAMLYLKDINCPMLMVGGWNDEQNIYGTIKSYEAVSKNNKAVTKYIVGPWTHGDYKSHDSLNYVGNIYYGKGFNQEYFKKEFDFFQAYLNNGPADTASVISLFNTGDKNWFSGAAMPATSSHTFYLVPGEKLSSTQPASDENIFFEYLSDPAKPVPYVEDDNFNLSVSKSSMTADQRFASKRPDVLTFTTDVLEEDMTWSGEINALLKFSTDHEDADLIVKLIDVLPMDRQPEPTDKPGLKMNGYQQLVRTGYIRGRYREDFSAPKPFVPNTITDVNIELLNIFHTFKKGHRIMVQIQSSLFPLFDRNPQKYVSNIFDANDSDFVKANHRIYTGSKIVFQEYIFKK